MQQKKQNEVTTAKKYAEYRREKENGKKRAHQPHAPKWLKNPLTWAALTVALALAAFGTVYFVNRSRVVEPDSGIAGYYSMAQTVMGGGVDGAVLDSVNLSVDGEDTVIRMAFTGGVPSYTVSALSNPARVIVSLGNLNGWEHSSALDCDGQSLVLGMFRNQKSADGVTELYFQTTRQIGYRMSEEGSELVLRLRSLNTSADTGYYVTLGAYEAYCAGLFDAQDMMPVLCADGASVALISPRCDTRVEAEAYEQSLEARLSETLPGVTGSVVQLSGNEAPPLSDAAERASLSAADVYHPYEGSASPWLWTSNGRLISWMPDMKRALFTRQTAAADDDGDYCELWLYDQAGKGQRLLDLEFRSVSDARFSASGDALAFVETTDSESLLYYYSISSGKFVSLSDYVGSDTYGFDFAGDGSIYLVGGTDQPQLMRWDPTLTFGDSARLIEDELGLTGSLRMGSMDYAPNTIFMSDGFVDTYAFAMDTGVRAELTSGGAFDMSPVGRYLSVMEYGGEVDVDT
ncbi:MAG: hypothetical protein SOX90_08990, partial [Candidatus Fimadaptatus sp.]|nr:hypothetical protein [Candidatus Fimadaptatus sp.]